MRSGSNPTIDCCFAAYTPRFIQIVKISGITFFASCKLVSLSSIKKMKAAQDRDRRTRGVRVSGFDKLSPRERRDDVLRTISIPAALDVIGRCPMEPGGLPTRYRRPFLGTGFCGGFTTFSAFSLDTALLVERHAYGLAAGYVVGSVSAGLLALFLGLSLFRTAAQ